MVQSRYCGNNLETNAGGQAEMFRNVVRGDTRIFSPLAVARLCVTIGRYWYLLNRLTAVSAGRFYRFEHIVSYSSGKVVAKLRSLKGNVPFILSDQGIANTELQR